MALTTDQINRYSRHLLLPEVGVGGQEKICTAKVLLIGTKKTTLNCLCRRISNSKKTAFVTGIIGLDGDNLAESLLKYD